MSCFQFHAWRNASCERIAMKQKQKKLYSRRLYRSTPPATGPHTSTNSRLVSNPETIRWSASSRCRAPWKIAKTIRTLWRKQCVVQHRQATHCNSHCDTNQSTDSWNKQLRRTMKKKNQFRCCCARTQLSAHNIFFFQRIDVPNGFHQTKKQQQSPHSLQIFDHNSPSIVYFFSEISRIPAFASNSIALTHFTQIPSGIGYNKRSATAGRLQTALFMRYTQR